MAAIQLADPLYEQVRLRATQAGFASVDEYVADILLQDTTPSPDFDHLFTPGRLAHLDQIVERMDNGSPTLTDADLDAHFKARRASWQPK